MRFARTEAVTEVFDVTTDGGANPSVDFPDIADGLHALAQPLSGLRSAVELLNLVDGGDDRRYREMCSTEIERACEMFACLQGLVSAATSKPKMSTFDLPELVRSLATEHGLADRFQAEHAAKWNRSEKGMVKGDAERARMAFASLFTVLIRFCGNARQMEASCCRQDDFLVCRFAPGVGNAQKLNASNRLHLSLTRANVVSQQGRFHSQADPFAVWIAMPLA